MKATELRIGNYVQELVLNTTCKVRGIGDGLIWLNGKLKMVESVIQPIPITEEWLLKFGFERTQNYIYSFLKLLDFEFEVDQDSDDEVLQLMTCSFKGKIIDIKIQYVHQLQNLYFALTGKELMIKS